jgi:hypothetical protein
MPKHKKLDISNKLILVKINIKKNLKFNYFKNDERQR